MAAEELYDQMFNAWVPLRSDFPHHDALRAPLRDMGMYVRGEYSLFTPLPEEVLEAERRIRQEQKEAKRAERQALGEDGDDEDLAGDAATETDGPTVDLRKAARALARKQKPSAKEEPSGQLNLFGGMIEGEQVSMFDAAPGEPTPEEPAPPTPPTEKSDAIPSPDLEWERRQIDAAREKAVAILMERGVAVTDAMMESAIEEAGREAVLPERLVGAAETYLQREIEKKYSLSYGYLGNGLTVWKRLEYEHGDYKTIAHIEQDRSVKFYDENLPELIRRRIRTTAATSNPTISATQDAPVFSPPQIARENGFTTPQGTVYHMGDVFGGGSERDKAASHIEIVGGNDDYIYFKLLLLPTQDPVEMSRKEFEDHLDNGRLVLVPTAEPQEKTTTERAETDAPKQTDAYATPKGVAYRVGEFFDNYDAEGASQVRFQLTGVDDDYIYYVFPDLPEQAPAKMFRDRFEEYLDRGTHSRGLLNVCL